jgi:hypothetical protein
MIGIEVGMPSIIKARHNGEVINVPVCWSQARAEECAALHPPDGVVDVDDQKGPGTAIEQKWFKNEVLRLMAL